MLETRMLRVRISPMTPKNDCISQPPLAVPTTWQPGAKIPLIWHLQPIIELKDLSTVGSELLTRPVVVPPPVLWAWARCQGYVASLEQRTYQAAVVLRPAIAGRIFLNIDPAMLQSSLPNTRIWEQLHPIALEVTENALPEVVALNHVRSLGLDIAIDDWGVGEGMIEKLTDWPATWLKLDRSVVMRAPDSPSYRDFLLYILVYARKHNIQTIAEGIETEKELATMQALGVQYGQGYYWGQPTPALEGVWDVPDSPGNPDNPS